MYIISASLQRAHNPEVVGSNPAPATKIAALACESGSGFFFVGEFFDRKSLPRGLFFDSCKGVWESLKSWLSGPFYLFRR